MRTVEVELAWSETAGLTVHTLDERLHVVAHPGLSVAQVARACGQLGNVGPGVFDAWRKAVSA